MPSVAPNAPSFLAPPLSTTRALRVTNPPKQHQGAVLNTVNQRIIRVYRRHHRQHAHIECARLHFHRREVLEQTKFVLECILSRAYSAYELLHWVTVHRVHTKHSSVCFAVFSPLFHVLLLVLAVRRRDAGVLLTQPTNIKSLSRNKLKELQILSVVLEQSRRCLVERNSARFEGFYSMTGKATLKADPPVYMADDTST